MSKLKKIMQNGYKVLWSKKAVEDLSNIIDYLRLSYNKLV
jgi:hypothetical protein